jgi:hypothetical protein
LISSKDERRQSGKTAEFLARKIPCSWDERSRKRKKNPTPTKDLQGIDGGVGMKKLSIEYGLPINFLL